MLSISFNDFHFNLPFYITDMKYINMIVFDLLHFVMPSNIFYNDVCINARKNKWVKTTKFEFDCNYNVLLNMVSRFQLNVNAMYFLDNDNTCLYVLYQYLHNRFLSKKHNKKSSYNNTKNMNAKDKNCYWFCSLCSLYMFTSFQSWSAEVLPLFAYER